MSLIYIFDKLVIQLLNFVDEILRMFTISLFKFDQFILHLFSVLLHIIKQFLIHFKTLKSVVHFGRQNIVLVINFLLK